MPWARWQGCCPVQEGPSQAHSPARTACLASWLWGRRTGRRLVLGNCSCVVNLVLGGFGWFGGFLGLLVFFLVCARLSAAEISFAFN